MTYRTQNATMEREDLQGVIPMDLPESSAPPVPSRMEGAMVGTLAGFADDGTCPLVTYPGQPGTSALRAISITDLRGSHIASRVVLMFEAGDPGRPIVVGRVHEPQPPECLNQVEVEADGERLLISAKHQVVLRCGRASITLTCDGKVLINGTYVSNRSSGVLRVKGGAVHIN